MRKFALIAAAFAFIAATQSFAQQQSAAQPKVKSQKELEAVQAVFNAPDPDGRIKAVEALLAKYADTEFKAIALYVAATSAQQKNDFEKMMLYSERTLEADPKNYATKLMMAAGIAQRTKEFDLDKEEKLSRSEKLAKEALEDLKTAVKPRPDFTDEQWEAAKKDFVGQAHEALGMVAMSRKKYDQAIEEFKTASESGQVDPATYVRLGAAYNAAGKPDAAIRVLDKVMALTDVHPAVKQFAQAEKVRATQLKNAAGKPTAPAAPPQVEIKQP
jgi:tetratricopeptide (TPR) repeat protein